MRLNAKGRWEYECATCLLWLPPKMYKKGGKRKDRVAHFCNECVALTILKEQSKKTSNRLRSAVRRVSLRRADVGRGDKDAVASVYAQAVMLTNITSTEHHVDHVIPLEHELVCGLHTIANLQILTSRENIVKSNHFVPYYETPDGTRRLIVEDKGRLVVPIKPQIKSTVRLVKRVAF